MLYKIPEVLNQEQLKNVQKSLWQVREGLLSNDPTVDAAQKLDVSYVNLLRIWSEPI